MIIAVIASVIAIALISLFIFWLVHYIKAKQNGLDFSFSNFLGSDHDDRQSLLTET